MLSAKKKRNIEKGRKLLTLFAFAIPIMLTGIFRILYNIADNIVSKQFSGKPSASVLPT